MKPVSGVIVITSSRKALHSKYFVCKGKAEEIVQAVKATNVFVVLFNHALLPSWEGNLGYFYQTIVALA